MVLRRSTFHRRSRTFEYVARQKDCQACPVKDTCLPPRQKRRYLSLTMYHPVYLKARERNLTAAFPLVRRRRQTIAEGTFASLDRRSWAQSGLRGLRKVDCEGDMAALAHNVLKMIRRLGYGVGPPGSASPAKILLVAQRTLQRIRYRTSPRRLRHHSIFSGQAGCRKPQAFIPLGPPPS